MDPSHLEPLSARTRIHSTLLHRTSGVSEAFSELGPAVTLFENVAGGRVAVLAANCGAGLSLAANCGAGISLTAPGRSFYDEDRKRELLELLAFVCGKPIAFYYPGDAEVYLKLRRFADHRYLLAIFNLGHDPLDVIPLSSPYAIAGSEILAPGGTWQGIPYSSGCLQTPLLPAEPKAFRISAEQAVEQR